MSKVVFLGHLISSEGIYVDPEKAEVILNWERLKTVTKVHSFMGLVGYYIKFIESFSKIALLLTSLKRKNAKFEWNGIL